MERKAKTRKDAARKVLAEVRGVGRSFPDGDGVTSALRSLSFDIYEGEFLAVSGVAGSGKTTAFRIIAGFDRPDTGTVDFRGETASRSLIPRPSQVGLIFESPVLIEQATVLKNVLLPCVYARTPRRRRRDKARAALDLVGQTKNIKRRPEDLSELERRKVAIAAACAPDPAVFLADEPTGGLGSAASAEIMSVLERLHRAGKTVVLFTAASDIARHAERQVKLSGGRITASTRTRKRLSAVKKVLGDDGG